MAAKKCIGITSVQCPTTGRIYRIGVELDFHELIRRYAHRAIDNKSGKARLANGAITVVAQEMGK